MQLIRNFETKNLTLKITPFTKITLLRKQISQIKNLFESTFYPFLFEPFLIFLASNKQYLFANNDFFEAFFVESITSVNQHFFTFNLIFNFVSSKNWKMQICGT